jgi:hypothetical protein
MLGSDKFGLPNILQNSASPRTSRYYHRDIPKALYFMTSVAKNVRRGNKMPTTALQLASLKLLRFNPTAVTGKFEHSYKCCSCAEISLKLWGRVQQRRNAQRGV